MENKLTDKIKFKAKKLELKKSKNIVVELYKYILELSLKSSPK